MFKATSESEPQPRRAVPAVTRDPALPLFGASAQKGFEYLGIHT